MYEHNSNKLQIYDIRNDQWNIANVRFSTRAYHNVHYAKGKIYVLGGKKLSTGSLRENLNAIVEVSDIQNKLLLSSESNPHQAVNFASGLYNDALIVMNGSTKKYRKKKNYTNEVHLFDLKTGYWYEMERTPYAYETTGIVVDRVLYLVGGFNDQALPYINSYNPLSGTYRTEAILPFQLERPALAYDTVGKSIYVFEKSMLLVYNLESKDLYRYRIDLDLMYSQMVCKGNHLYIIGGRTVDANLVPVTLGGVKSNSVSGSGDDSGLPVGIISAPSAGLFRIDINALAGTKSYKVPYRRNANQWVLREEE